MMTILSLCDRTGIWSQPYRDMGYDVYQVDIAHGHDVRLFEALPFPVRGVIAQPPCTHFAGSGARWWKDKGDQALLDGLAIVDACLRVVTVHRPQWWVLENPVGRLSRYLGPPVHTFQPCDYGETYKKKTCLWGAFKMPQMTKVEPVEGSKMHRLPPSPDRADLRSVTPKKFAEAFARANP